MNFLAHLFLSGESTELLVGNFIGDFVKGRQFENFDAGIQKGVLLHREIDHFTDRHPTVAQSKAKLREKYRHYAGVMVDMFYDHFLARNWMAFHQMPLETYATNAYKIISTYDSILPERLRHMLFYMIRDNWLVNYREIEGISRALSGISSRTKFDSKMDQGRTELELHHDAFEKEFMGFFPDLIKHVDIWKSQNEVV